ncbi:hypothetical protein ACIP9C_22565 [Lysinibacillus sp. NPDC093210]|uniref:hypothetical protein n=1 Tax=Lysinibacillus sp. NPDC093210 TaxID=3364133 RepID=UPI00382BD0FA
MTKTKNERITTLENEVAELKLIVHELRERPQLTTVVNNAPQGPSTTNTVEDIIEFEGQQYRKVNREAREDDYVSVSFKEGKCFKPNKIYGPVFKEGNDLYVNADSSTGERDYEEALVYNSMYNRRPETVDVYELIESKPLTPNQQRAAIIEKAKKFVEENNNKIHPGNDERTTIRFTGNITDKLEFVVNVEKRTVVALIKGIVSGDLYARGIAKCLPNDVFNEHIGKAIALGRALGLDVSEFEQAVQPTVAEGQILNKYCNYEVLTLEDKDGNLKIVDSGNFANGGDLPNTDWYTIINDTNAIYGGVE